MRPAAALVLTTLLVVLAAGCGGGSDDGDDGVAGPDLTAGGSQATEATDAADAAAAAVRDAVRGARDGDPVPSTLTPSLDDIGDSVADLGRCNYAKDVRRLCPEGDPDASRSLVLYGNSHGRHWIDAVDAMAAAHGYTAYNLVKPQCLASLVTPDERDGTPDESCADFQAWAMQEIADLQPDLVLVSSSGTRGTVFEPDGTRVSGADAVEAAVDEGDLRLFATLADAADRTVLLEDIPFLDPGPDGVPSACLGEPGATLAGCLAGTDPTVAAATADQVGVAEDAGVDVVRTARWFCWHGTCPPVVGDVVTYRDDEHMTNEYSQQLADPLAAALGLG